MRNAIGFDEVAAKRHSHAEHLKQVSGGTAVRSWSGSAAVQTVRQVLPAADGNPEQVRIGIVTDSPTAWNAAFRIVDRRI